MSEFHPIVQVLKNSDQNPIHYYLIQNNVGLCSLPGCHLCHGQERQSCCWAHCSMGIDDGTNSYLCGPDSFIVEISIELV